MVKCLGCLIAFALSMAIPRASAALLDGHVVNATYYHPTLSSPVHNGGNQTVGSGIEYPGFWSHFDINLTDYTIVISNFAFSGQITPATFSGIVITDVSGSIPQFVSVSVNSATNHASFTSSRLSFSDDQIFINLQGLWKTEATVLAVDINGGGDPQNGPLVPEPAAVWLTTSGIAVLLLKHRRSS